MTPRYTYTVEPRRTKFARRGYAVSFWRDGDPWKWFPAGAPLGETAVKFYGDDGRKVRAEALRFAKAECAKLERRDLSPRKEP